MRLKGVTDGNQVNIPELFISGEVGTKKARLSRRWLSWYLHIGGVTWQIRLRVNAEVRSGSDTLVYREVTDARLPGKAASHNL